MKTNDAIRHAGSTKALANLFKITPSAVSQWPEELPEARMWQLKGLRPGWFKKPRASHASAPIAQA